MSDLPAYANFEPVLCLTPGLFRSLQRGKRAETLDLIWHKGEPNPDKMPDEAYRFKADKLLGADDLRVLQGVLAFAPRDGPPTIIFPEAGGDLGRLRERVRLEDGAKDGDALLVTLVSGVNLGIFRTSDASGAGRGTRDAASVLTRPAAWLGEHRSRRGRTWTA